MFLLESRGRPNRRRAPGEYSVLFRKSSKVEGTDVSVSGGVFGANALNRFGLWLPLDIIRCLPPKKKLRQ